MSLNLLNGWLLTGAKVVGGTWAADSDWDCEMWTTDAGCSSASTLHTVTVYVSLLSVERSKSDGSPKQ